LPGFVGILPESNGMHNQDIHDGELVVVTAPDEKRWQTRDDGRWISFLEDTMYLAQSHGQNK
jgi:hypothetical protein